MSVCVAPCNDYDHAIKALAGYGPIIGYDVLSMLSPAPSAMDKLVDLLACVLLWVSLFIRFRERRMVEIHQRDHLLFFHRHFLQNDFSSDGRKHISMGGNGGLSPFITIHPSAKQKKNQIFSSIHAGGYCVGPLPSIPSTLR